ncbi:MAG: phage head morphogenesis protein [Alphaproteobacteria bacterium]|nr:phage head morphogenesis protein [Alphaproteobacteria bacterium]MDA8003351.1 phage head morphogenesis protein [Alphaproteobacteria bacterium]MDA8005315.1 phage head morphogenesis protein [Alphaproteobacteria bacterium]MDA8012736.1 phage head morphogenesis protein [Alphaproteobacteria bacterium]
MAETRRLGDLLGEAVMVRWKTTFDGRARDTHIARHNKIYTIDQASALIGEPNCRCAVVPVVPE